MSRRERGAERRRSGKPPAFPYFWRILRDTIKKRTFIFLIGLQLFVVMTMGVMLSNITVVFDTQKMLRKPLRLAVIDGIDPVLEEMLQNDPKIDLHKARTEQDALRMFHNFRLDAYLYEDRTEAISLLTIVVPKSDINGPITKSLLKSKLEKFDEIRRLQGGFIGLSLSTMTYSGEPSESAAMIIEILFSLLLPFVLLLPGMLFASLAIDIITEEFDRSTMDLLRMVTSLRKVVMELVIGLGALSSVTMLVWTSLLILKGVIIRNLASVIIVTVFTNALLVLFAVLLTLQFSDKTKAQLVYSFALIFLFTSSKLTALSPIGAISTLAIGIDWVNMPLLLGVYLSIIIASSALIWYLIQKMEKE